MVETRILVTMVCLYLTVYAASNGQALIAFVGLCGALLWGWNTYQSIKEEVDS